MKPLEEVGNGNNQYQRNHPTKAKPATLNDNSYSKLGVPITPDDLPSIAGLDIRAATAAIKDKNHLAVWITPDGKAWGNWDHDHALASAGMAKGFSAATPVQDVNGLHWTGFVRVMPLLNNMVLYGPISRPAGETALNFISKMRNPETMTWNHGSLWRSATLSAKVKEQGGGKVLEDLARERLGQTRWLKDGEGWDSLEKYIRSGGALRESWIGTQEAFNPDEPRDEKGQWTYGAGGPTDHDVLISTGSDDPYTQRLRSQWLRSQLEKRGLTFASPEIRPPGKGNTYPGVKFNFLWTGPLDSKLSGDDWRAHVLETLNNLNEAYDQAFQEAVEQAHLAAEREQTYTLLEQIEEQLTSDLQFAFKAQGRIFLREFAADHKLAWADMIEAAPTHTSWERSFAEASSVTHRRFTTALMRAVKAAMLIGGDFVSSMVGYDPDLTFSLNNPRAEAYIAEHGADLVTRVDNTTRDGIRDLIGQAVQEGASPDTVQRRIRAMYAGFSQPKPQAHIRNRAHLIAVTEVGNAYSAGNLSAAKDLAEAGLPMEKSWLTLRDPRVDPDCLANEAVGWLPLADPYPDGNQAPLAHPACRCDQLYRLVRVRKLTEHYDPNQPRDEKGMWTSFGVSTVSRVEPEGNDPHSSLYHAREYGTNTPEKNAADLYGDNKTAHAQLTSAEKQHLVAERNAVSFFEPKGSKQPGDPYFQDRVAGEVKDQNAKEAARRMTLDPAAAAHFDKIDVAQGYRSSGTGEVSREPRGSAYLFAENIQHSWAMSSSDSNVRSIALHLAVADEFKLPSTIEVPAQIKWRANLDKPQYDAARKEYESDKPRYRGYVRAVYENTQEQLKAAGVEKVGLYRGLRLSEEYVDSSGSTKFRIPPNISDGKPHTLHVYSNPVSSWSSDPFTAQSFAGTSGTVMHVTVPRERIFSTALSGPGALNEQEWLVIGGEMDVRARYNGG